MKIYPKCRGLYFDQDQQCDNCKIKLLDKDDFNKTLGEYYQMNHSQRVANRYNPHMKLYVNINFLRFMNIMSKNLSKNTKHSNV